MLGRGSLRSLLSALAIAMTLARTSGAADSPLIAVLVEPGMPYFHTPPLSAGRIVKQVGQLGIPVEALSAAQVADPQVFHAQRYTALIMPYENNFPLSAFESIRAFHRAGGCLIMNGVPFCHPCVVVAPGASSTQRAETAYKDLGHDLRYLEHDDFGMGTGGVGILTTRADQFVVAPGNPLGLTEASLPRLKGVIQGIGVEALDKQDEVLPLVVARAPGRADAPLAVLIRHRCARFNGARDVWLGNVVGGLGLEQSYAAAQLFARGAAWCLAEKEVWSKEAFAAALARLDQQPKPALPADLPIIDTPRPWGETFFPKSNPPANEMLVVDARQLEKPQRLALICLQGLVARRQPRIWLLNLDKDETTLQWHKEGGFIHSTKAVSDWRSLFKTFASEIEGAVIPDDTLYQGNLLACNVAACEDCVVAPESLARELGLPVKVDLRRRFSTYADGMRWVWDTYKDRLNHLLFMTLAPERAASGALSYDIEWRSVIFWISGLKDGDRPGADMEAEYRLMAEILSQTPPNAGIRGFPGAAPGMGLDETPGVILFSSYGKGLVASELTGNMCAMSGVRIDRFTPPPPLKAPPLEQDKIYVAFTMSDGDNINTFADFFGKYFDDPAHGTFPMGWGMGPAILDLMPGVAEHYYRHAKPGDEFLADVTGVAYVYSKLYGAGFRDRDKVMSGFTDWTDRYMKRMGMDAIRIHGGPGTADPAELELDHFARLTSARMFLPDYGRRVAEYADANFFLPDGRPVFRALVDQTDKKEGLIPSIRRRVGTTRPAFVNAFIQNWSFDMAALKKTVDARDKDMIFVSPSQLAELYRQARGTGK